MKNKKCVKCGTKENLILHKDKPMCESCHYKEHNVKKKLIWKYFFQQKREEIFKFFKIFLSFILISAVAIFILILINNYVAYPIGNWLYEIYPDLFLDNVGGYHSDRLNLCGGGWAFIVIFGIIMFLLGYQIWNWIKDNWEQAKERVEKEIGKK